VNERVDENGPLAQLAEQGTLNPKVAGSTPARPIKKRNMKLEMQRISSFMFRFSILAFNTAKR
jgi:hypothetical protein